MEEENQETMKTTGLSGFETGESVKDKFDLDPKDIKAFWLKSQVSQNVDSDPLNSQKITEKIFEILSNESNNDRVCETKLVELLNFDKFEFIKLLLKNRLKIVWCTKWSHSESDEKKKRN